MGSHGLVHGTHSRVPYHPTAQHTLATQPSLKILSISPMNKALFQRLIMFGRLYCVSPGASRAVPLERLAREANTVSIVDIASKSFYK